MMKISAFLVILAVASVFPAPVSAYVGPGAALSLLGAFWGLIAAIGAALAFALAWPVRRFLQMRREKRVNVRAVEPADPRHASEA